MATLNFNATEVAPSIAFEAIPAGKYTTVITDSDMKDTRSGNGRYLQLEFEIIEGEYKGVNSGLASISKIRNRKLSALPVLICQPSAMPSMFRSPMTLSNCTTSPSW